MKLAHFERLAPICPVCRAAGLESRLQLGRIEKGTATEIEEGALLCSFAGCQREYPILLGIPILLSAIRAFIESSLLPILARNDFAPSTLSMLGDCSQPGSVFDTIRSHQSSYGYNHFQEFITASSRIPAESLNDTAGSLASLVRSAMSLAGAVPTGPQIDLGCGPGRATWEMARQLDEAGSDDLVLGIDMSVPLLQLARAAMSQQRVTFPLRRVGIVYDYVHAIVPKEHYERVDFWCCDATDLPFRDQQFARLAAMNVIDSLGSPLALLQSMSRTMMPGGCAMIASPYDWSSAVTPMEQWIGGHSQRSRNEGQSDAMLRELLTPGMHPQSIAGLSIAAEQDRIPWKLRLHDRSSVHYDVHLTIAAKS